LLEIFKDILRTITNATFFSRFVIAILTKGFIVVPRQVSQRMHGSY